MKKKYFTLFVLLCFGNFGFGQGFGTDVIIENPPVNSHGEVKIASAFNGWLFSIYALDGGGIALMKSTNNGLTWTSFNGVPSPSPLEWLSYDIEVIGSTLATLKVVSVEITEDIATSEFTLTSYIYNSVSEVAEAEFIHSSGTDFIYDVDLAKTDTKLGCIYSKTSAIDSVIVVEAISGITWGVPKTVAQTNRYFNNVSLCYGRSQDNPIPVAFATWDQFQNFGTTQGKIYTSKAENNAVWDEPIEMDIQLVNPTRCSNPKIAVMNSGSLVIPGGSVSAMIVFEYDYYNDSTDIDVKGFYNTNARVDNTWININISSTSNSEVSPDIIYGNNDFAISYFNIDQDSIFVNANTYELDPNDMLPIGVANDASVGANARPNLAYNASKLSFDVVWTRTLGGNSFSMYDSFYDRFAEISDNGPIALSNVYPNPTSEAFTIEFEASGNEKYSIELIDLNGKVVLKQQVESVSGLQQVKFIVNELSKGMYTVKLYSKADVFTSKLNIQ